jgi:hypothetical protein
MTRPLGLSLWVWFVSALIPVLAATGPPPPQPQEAVTGTAAQRTVTLMVDPGDKLFIDPAWNDGSVGPCRQAQNLASAATIIAIAAKREWSSWIAPQTRPDDTEFTRGLAAQSICCRPTTDTLCQGASGGTVSAAIQGTGTSGYGVLNGPGTAVATCNDGVYGTYIDQRSYRCGQTGTGASADGQWRQEGDDSNRCAANAYVVNGACSAACGGGNLYQTVYNSCGRITGQGYTGAACNSQNCCVSDGACSGACGGGTGVDNCGNACTNNAACPTCCQPTWSKTAGASYCVPLNADIRFTRYDYSDSSSCGGVMFFQYYYYTGIECKPGINEINAGNYIEGFYQNGNGPLSVPQSTGVSGNRLCSNGLTATCVPSGGCSTCSGPYGSGPGVDSCGQPCTPTEDCCARNPNLCGGGGGGSCSPSACSVAHGSCTVGPYPGCAHTIACAAGYVLSNGACVVSGGGTCNPSAVTNGTVGAYPGCAVSCIANAGYDGVGACSCNSGYTLSGGACIASGGGGACSPASVTNGTVGAYPGCAITCNSGFSLSNGSCVASGGGCVPLTSTTGLCQGNCGDGAGTQMVIVTDSCGHLTSSTQPCTKGPVPACYPPGTPYPQPNPYGPVCQNTLIASGADPKGCFPDSGQCYLYYTYCSADFYQGLSTDLCTCQVTALPSYDGVTVGSTANSQYSVGYKSQTTVCVYDSGASYGLICSSVTSP